MKTTTLAIAATLGFVGVANARDVAVSTRMVDFASATSVDALHRDLAEAAKEACGDESGPGVAGLKAERACRSDAVERAVADLDQPLLNALNDSLDARLRINPSRPTMSAAALAALESDIRQQRAEAPPSSVTR